MLTVLGYLAMQQDSPTQNTMKKVHQFLDYTATHPDAIITYHASDMVLVVHSGALYLSESNARSRNGGHFFMSNNSADLPNNGAVLSVAQIIKSVMSFAAKAELGALYINFREAIPARHTLTEMGHPQPPTQVQTNNTTTLGVVNNTIAPRRTKATDMRLYWLRDRIQQLQFCHYWMPGPYNKGDYVTKNHATIRGRTDKTQNSKNADFFLLEPYDAVYT